MYEQVWTILTLMLVIFLEISMATPAEIKPTLHKSNTPDLLYFATRTTHLKMLYANSVLKLETGEFQKNWRVSLNPLRSSAPQSKKHNLQI